jgi:chlorite dismutase
MGHIRKFNEEVNYNTHQTDDYRIFGDDLDRVVWFVRDNKDNILELIEFWETSHGRDFNVEEYNKWFNSHMSYGRA